jgi:hypothetical protein
MATSASVSLILAVLISTSLISSISAKPQPQYEGYEVDGSVESTFSQEPATAEYMNSINHGISSPDDYYSDANLCPIHTRSNGQALLKRDPFRCDRFIICSWGTPYFFSCPAGQRWDDKLKTCNFAKKVFCGFPARSRLFKISSKASEA